MQVEMFREVDLVEKFGIQVSQWVDYQCLCGDVADGVKTFHGMGPVSAAKILQAYPFEPLELLDREELREKKLLNKPQHEGWPAFVEHLGVYRAVFTLESTLPYSLEITNENQASNC
jgi:5'-3' exonuclease